MGPRHELAIAIQKAIGWSVDLQVRLDKRSVGVGASIDVALPPSLNGSGTTCKDNSPILCGDSSTDVLQLRVLDDQGSGERSFTGRRYADESGGIDNLSINDRLGAYSTNVDIEPDFAILDCQALPSPTWARCYKYEYGSLGSGDERTPVPDRHDGSFRIVNRKVLHCEPDSTDEH